MNAYIRVDASMDIGTGHVMRCLTLAGCLRKQGITVRFICREHRGHLCDYIEEKGFEVFRLPPCRIPDEKYHNHTPYQRWLGVPLQVDASQTMEILKRENVDLLIIDHYGIDERWEKKLRSLSKKLVVIDDLADRRHACDLLLDQNYYENYQARYHALVPSHCKLFLGPGYVLMREEFHEQQRKLTLRKGPVKRILIFFGGIDQSNETKKAVDSFLRLGREDIQVDVVVGKSNPHLKELEETYQRYANVHMHCQVSNIAEFMCLADLSIGAGGSTTWERCYLGLPTMVWSVADNQVEICQALANKHLIHYLGDKKTVDEDFIAEQLGDLINNEVKRHEMSRLSYHFMRDLHMSQQTMIEEITS